MTIYIKPIDTEQYKFAMLNPMKKRFLKYTDNYLWLNQFNMTGPGLTGKPTSKKYLELRGRKRALRAKMKAAGATEAEILKATLALGSF